MVDILAFGAHPDDIEFACGGILAKEAALGRSIAIVDLTTGDKGSNGTIEGRKQEGIDAAALIGAERHYLTFNDCEVFDTYPGRLELVRMIRELKPRLILAPMWKGEQNHPDHIACGAMARAAARFSRFKNVLPDVPPHRVEGILHYPHGAFADHSDFIIDISPYVETWKKMITAHASQMNTLPYLEMNLAAAAKLGTLIDVPFAQGLIKGNPLVIDDLFAIGKSAREL